MLDLGGGEGRVSREHAVYLSAGGVFAVCALLTLHFARTMADGMAMPGGWTMSMMWMRMPGQSWLAAAAVFVVMWVAMMVAMMLPSSLPMMLLYRRVIAFRGDRGLAAATWSLGAGYFAVWLAFGIAAYGAGVAVAAVAMRFESVSRAVPIASAAVLLTAGCYQLTRWKSACLRHCRDPLHLVARHLDRGDWRGALGLGLHHGAFCAGCCWGLMLVQLVLGVMNVAAMVLVAVVIAAEKLLGRGEWIARAAGVAAILAGVGMALGLDL
jgi:predicted metal-binding membrane protein